MCSPHIVPTTTVHFPFIAEGIPPRLPFDTGPPQPPTDDSPHCTARSEPLLFFSPLISPLSFPFLTAVLHTLRVYAAKKKRSEAAACVRTRRTRAIAQRPFHHRHPQSSELAGVIEGTPPSPPVRPRFPPHLSPRPRKKGGSFDTRAQFHRKIEKGDILQSCTLTCV